MVLYLPRKKCYLTFSFFALYNSFVCIQLAFALHFQRVFIALTSMLMRFIFFFFRKIFILFTAIFSPFVKDFDTFQESFVEVFLCFSDNTQLIFFAYRKKKLKEMFDQFFVQFKKSTLVARTTCKIIIYKLLKIT